MSKFGKFLTFVGLILGICVIAVILAESVGIRDRWEAQKYQAQAQKIEAQAARERQLPLITAALVDTFLAVAYAAFDKLLLIMLVTYLILKGVSDESESKSEADADATGDDGQA